MPTSRHKCLEPFFCNCDEKKPNFYCRRPPDTLHWHPSDYGRYRKYCRNLRFSLYFVRHCAPKFISNDRVMSFLSQPKKVLISLTSTIHGVTSAYHLQTKYYYDSNSYIACYNCDARCWGSEQLGYRYFLSYLCILHCQSGYHWKVSASFTSRLQAPSILKYRFAL